VTDLSDLPFLDITTDSFLNDRVRVITEAMAEHSVYRSKRGVEVLAYEPQWPLLRDRRLAQDQIGMVQDAGISHPEVLRLRRENLNSSLGRDHVRMRSTVAPFFGKQYTESVRGTIRGFIDQLLDELPDQPTADLLDGVCQRLPAMVYAYLVGAPFSDVPFVRRISSESLLIGERDPGLREVVENANLALIEYTKTRFGAIENNSSSVPDGPLSGVLTAVRDGKITRSEAVSLAAMLLTASTDNTAHEMALIAGLLLENRAVWAELAGDQSLIPQAVEEAMRVRPRALQNERRALEDFEWNGYEIPAGVTFFMSTIGANLDPGAYPDPEKFDIHREKPAPLVMFGAGMQACLGSNLARIEFHEWISALLTRFPNMELAEPARIRTNMITNEVLNLDVILN
jgi:cytochrome P450